MHNNQTMDAFPLYTAVQEQDRASVAHLIATGIDVNLPNWEGCTPLELAAALCDVKILTLLLDAEAQVTDNALVIAVGVGCTEAVSLLLTRGGNVSSSDAEGNTLLMLAAEWGDFPCAQVLLAHGAEVNTRNQDRMTALLYAAQAGSDALVRLLLQRRADIDASDAEGWTALTHAAFRGHSAVVDRLLNQGANPNLRDVDGRNAAYWAVVGGHLKVLRLLLSRGVVLDPKRDGTAMMVAALEGYTDIILVLTEAGLPLGPTGLVLNNGQSLIG